MNDEQLLRDRLRAEVAGVDLPAGLAAAVERGSRRRRRTRMAAAGAVAATLLVSGGLVAGLRGTAAAPPAAPSAPDVCADRFRTVFVEPAPADADISGWGYRGDGTLRPALDGIARAVGRADRTVAVPLLGERLSGDRVVYGIAVRQPDRWILRLASGRTDGAAVVLETGYITTTVPAPAPGAQISAIVPRHAPDLEPGAFSDLRNVLIVLAPRGTARIDYTGCRDGAAFRVGAAGDTLIRDVGFLRVPGRLTIGGWSGPPTSVEQIVLRRPADPTAPPGDWTTLARAQGQMIVSDQLVDVRLPEPHRRYAATKVLAGCLGLGRMEVLVSPIGTVPLTCDGQPHELYAGPLDTGKDKVWGIGRDDPGVRRTSLSLTVLVVRASAPR